METWNDMNRIELNISASPSSDERDYEIRSVALCRSSLIKCMQWWIASAALAHNYSHTWKMEKWKMFEVRSHSHQRRCKVPSLCVALQMLVLSHSGLGCKMKSQQQETKKQRLSCKFSQNKTKQNKYSANIRNQWFIEWTLCYVPSSSNVFRIMFVTFDNV